MILMTSSLDSWIPIQVIAIPSYLLGMRTVLQTTLMALDRDNVSMVSFLVSVRLTYSQSLQCTSLMW